MYIQITTRCNMKCDHCCMRATAKGEDMDRDTFFQAASLAENYGDYITIGGGEPTLHPKLFDFIGIAMSVDHDEIVPHVITNGKLKAPALKLAKMAKNGYIGAELSQDEWHDRISNEVVTAFTRNDRYYERDNNDYRGIRSVTRIVHMGRAADNEISTEAGCACDDLFVEPDGTIWACGHKEEQFGDVFSSSIPEDYGSRDNKCSRKQERWEEAA